uniref:Uncharacterized protein n=1 Tax=Romanomermis culicivorax TaxID=13658 RepID=A0A915JR37_ROMCU
MGLENMPSYELTSEAKISSPYRLHFPAKFYDNFALLITFNPASYQQNGGYLFSITDAFDTGVDLGLVLEPVEEDPRNLAKSRETGDLTYQLAFVRQEDVDTTVGGGFSFELKNSLIVGQVANKWTQLALKVTDENIILEVGCPKRTNIISSLRDKKNSRDIRFDEAAKIYIGSGGPILKKNFVSHLYLPHGTKGRFTFRSVCLEVTAGRFPRNRSYLF